MPRSHKGADMAMQHAWIPGTGKTTRPQTTLQSNHSPLHAQSATYSNHITGNMHCIYILQLEMVQVVTTMTNGNRYTVIFFQDEHTNSLTFKDLEDPSMYPATVQTKVHNRLRRNFPEAYERFI